jgi:hypothetical protein
MINLSLLRARFEVRQFQPFPRNEAELGGNDIADLAELDAFLSGYVSRSISGERLLEADFAKMKAARTELSDLLPDFSGSAGLYFEELAALAQEAVNLQQARAEAGR